MILGMDLFNMKQRRRDKARAADFPAAWRDVLERGVPLFARVPADSRQALIDDTKVFLDEKTFEGCEGFVVDDAVRVVIASQACLLLLNRETDYYPSLDSILVYPKEYTAPVVEYDGQIVTEYEAERSGETWDQGSLILSWEDVLASGFDAHGAYNVVLHEFAHQLDFENGALDGVPRLSGDGAHDHWQRVMSQSYKQLLAAAERGLPTVIDAYGCESPPEFFAVATEAFFEAPAILAQKSPELYALLKSYYNQDPAAW